MLASLAHPSRWFSVDPRAVLLLVMLAVTGACLGSDDPLTLGPEATLRNPSSACDADTITWVVVPGAADLGRWLTSRLTPPGTPFAVDSVSYQLKDDPGIGCDPTPLHRVRLFRGRGLAPPAVPEVAFEQEVQLALDPARIRTVEIAVEPAVILHDDEELFVAIEIAGTDMNWTCVKQCAKGQASDDHDYISTGDPPYSWATLFQDTMDHMTLDVRAHGNMLR